MASLISQRRDWQLIAWISFAGFVLRALAATGAGGPNGSQSDYDDGVYFAASALLTRGILPYRDFVFVHPPGLLYFLAPLSWLKDVALGFAAAHIAMMVVGGVNSFLVGLIARRAGGSLAGVVAATLYAIYPNAVTAERSSYLEPVLNLGCLVSAFLWLRETEDERERVQSDWLAGLFCGAACAVKLWGGIWVMAALLVTPFADMKRRIRFVAGAAIAGLLLLLPLALPAPHAYVEQTLTFQLSRPPDGTIGKLARLHEIADSGHRAATVFALVGLLAMVAVPEFRDRTRRHFALVMLLTVAGFLASSSYWASYNAHLAASQCVLAGLGASSLRLPRFPRFALLAAGLIVLLDAATIAEQLRSSRARDPLMRRGALQIPRFVPADASFFAFDPSYALAGGRLPPAEAPIIVDSYGAMLLDATRKTRPSSMDAAFQQSGDLGNVQRRLSASQYVLLGWRGVWQLNQTGRESFAQNFLCVNPEARVQCLWKHLDRPIRRKMAIDDHFLQYQEGWYAEEGQYPRSWRWMGGRGVISLPPRTAKASLTLSIKVPSELRPTPPTLTITFDNRPLDRFVATEPRITRTYTIESADEATHTLVLSTDRTFIPAATGKSADTRSLGLMVTEVNWGLAAARSSSRSPRSSKPSQ